MRFLGPKRDAAVDAKLKAEYRQKWTAKGNGDSNGDYNGGGDGGGDDDAVPEAVPEARRRLPAFTTREELLSVVAANQVVVIKGETGCGKTTQVPQFLLDDADRRGAGSSMQVGWPVRPSVGWSVGR